MILELSCIYILCVCRLQESYALSYSYRFYTEDAAENNDGYRAAGYTIELRDTGEYGFLLPPDQVPHIKYLNNLLSHYQPTLGC